MFRLIANGVEGDAMHGQGEGVAEGGGLIPTCVAGPRATAGSGGAVWPIAADRSKRR
jgi:hypothetical protein